MNAAQETELLQRLATVESNVSHLQEDISSMDSKLDEILQSLGGGGERFASLETQVNNLESRLERQDRWRAVTFAAVATALASSAASFFKS